MQDDPLAHESGTRYVLNDELRRKFVAEGYLVFENVIPRTQLASLSQRIADEFDQQLRQG